MKLSIIIPVYNEDGTVNKIIEKVKKLKLSIKKEIIVIDDGSTDKSFEIIKNTSGIKIIRHKKNKGKGATIRTALKYLTGDIMIIQDADLELNPEEIINVINPIIKGKAKVVYGSRNIHKIKEGRQLRFYIGGLLVTWVTNLLYKTKLTDEPCGYKAFKTEIIRELEINSDGFEWEPEITAKIAKKGIKIYEVPVSYVPRREGKKINWKDGIKALWTLIYWRFKK